MFEYRVVAVIQSPNIDENAPVDVRWYTGDNLAKAVSAMVGAAVHDEDVDSSDLPVQMRYRTLSVRMEKVPVIVAEDKPQGYCHAHDGEHTFTDGSDGDEPCEGWHEGSATGSPDDDNDDDDYDPPFGRCDEHIGRHWYRDSTYEKPCVNFVEQP